MIRFAIVLVLIIIILLVLRSRSTNFSQNKYKKIILAVVVLGVILIIATSGRYLLPQAIQLIKIGLPFLTKFIGI
tara:strand:- start:259 stop:483 length:225 start_codon:yes stop_codon:yes gene_type:complete